MTGHLDLDALADVLADEASAGDAEHVAHCSGCADRLDELAAAEVEVAAVLATLAPPAVPDDLAPRLRSALAAAPAPSPAAPRAAPTPGDGDVDEPAGPVRSRTVTPFPAAAGRRRRRAPLAAAGVLVLAAGVAAVALRLSAGPPADPAAGDRATAGAPAPVVVPVSSTGRDYATGGLADALPALLRAPARPPSPVTGPLAGLHSTAQLRSCLAAVLPPGTAEQPLALDYAAWSGQPALVVVLPAVAAGKVDVFVVGAGCRTGDDQTLYFTRLDRPA